MANGLQKGLSETAQNTADKNPREVLVLDTYVNTANSLLSYFREYVTSPKNDLSMENDFLIMVIFKNKPGLNSLKIYLYWSRIAYTD